MEIPKESVVVSRFIDHGPAGSPPAHMNSPPGTQQPIEEVQRLARAVRAEAAYLRSLSLEVRKQRRAWPPVTEALDP